MQKDSHLYKFVSGVAAVEAMLQGSLKFTEPTKLNDPSELVGIINRDRVQASLEEIRQSGFNDELLQSLQRQSEIFQRFCPDLQAISPPTTIDEANQLTQLAVYGDLDFIEGMYQDLARRVRAQVGVASLTRTFNCLPMWAHYANVARGFVVVFSNLEASFTGDETHILNALKDMRYSSDFEGVTYDPTTTENLFFWKFSDWAYEQEVRIVRALSDCSQVQAGDEAIRVHTIAPTHVPEVIVGWNASDDDKARLIEFCRKSDRPIKLTQATFSGVEIQLEAMPVCG